MQKVRSGKVSTQTALRGLFAAACFGFAASAAPALTLEFPGPVAITAQRSETLASYALPLGPWVSTGLPVRQAEGALDLSAWRIDADGLTTLQILTPLRDQLTKAGFKLLFECETAACGGFDFRFDTNILPEPDMHVDLGDFRFLSAERIVSGKSEVVGLMVSRSSDAGFVQMTRVAPADVTPAPTPSVMAQNPIRAATTSVTLSSANMPATASVAPLPEATTGLDHQLLNGGAVVLEDLEFAPGASELAQGEYASLQALADWLKGNPDKSVALVGHTDASGGLEANISLSRRRAEQCRALLVRDFGVSEKQVTAEGVGYLSPRDTNLTDEGRAKNRRVVAILTATR